VSPDESHSRVPINSGLRWRASLAARGLGLARVVALLLGVRSGSRNCIPLSSPSPSFDAVGDRLMFRAAYRNFGDHQSITLVWNTAGAQSMPPGVYDGALWLVNNDPAAQQARLPVRLTVAPPPGWLRLPLLQR
jgi:hypothetical protein